MAFDKKPNDSRLYHNKLSQPRKHKTRKDQDSVNNNNNNNNRVDDLTWSLSAADEDYIVFCFHENGAFDVINDDKNNHHEGNPTNSRPVNRKVLVFWLNLKCTLNHTLQKKFLNFEMS